MDPSKSNSASSRGSQKGHKCKFRTVISLESGTELARRPEDLISKENLSAEKCAGVGVWHEDKECPCEKVETCKSCETCVGGVVKHHPWDELEMLKHGWSDVHGHHWGGAKAAEDEVEMMHHGLITSKGAHLAHSSAHEHDTPPNHLGERGRVSFGRQVIVRQFKFKPEDVPSKFSTIGGGLRQYGYMPRQFSKIEHIADDVQPALLVAIPLLLLLGIWHQLFS